ncbi:hypothetical protein HAX54_032119 [Datura stramonium]|uniref:Uncharacterized protein n=1 Tax=Datura stramonium TaxID=4076 RepID=A0ABS8VAQ9_DATST|nr:hypothetical protein [Datura stramonium]
MTNNTIEDAILTNETIKDPNDQSDHCFNLPPLNIRRPPPHFQSLSSPVPEHFPPFLTVPITSIAKTTTIDLTISDPSTSYKTPLPASQTHIPHTIHSQNFPPIHHTPLAISQNPPTVHNRPILPTSTIQNPSAITNSYIPLATTFQVHRVPEPYPTLIAQPELDHYEDKERE